MQKRLILMVLAILCLLAVHTALADNEASVLTWDELSAWRDTYHEMAMAAAPLNDPTEPEAFSEDGYCFVYEFATLYADRPEMTADTQINALVVNNEDSPCLRNVPVDVPVTRLLNAFYNENGDLDGSREYAALYLVDMMPGGAAWGWLQRDGQRIAGVEYGVAEQHTTGGDGYVAAGLVYTIQDGYVAAVRAYGLNSRVDEDVVEDALHEVRQALSLTGYSQVPMSDDGLSLLPMNELDLRFAGITFPGETAESAAEVFGPMLEDFYMENEDGTMTRRVQFEQCELIFHCDADQSNPVLVEMDIFGDTMEGPRGVRIGDTITGVMSRFRHGESVYSAGHELLYGEENKGARGTADYTDDGDVTIRLTTPANDGEVTLTLDLTMYIVTGITLTYAE